MAKVRVHELAREFGVESRFVLDAFEEMGEFVKSASSTVSLGAEMRFRKDYGEQLKAGGSANVGRVRRAQNLFTTPDRDEGPARPRRQRTRRRTRRATAPRLSEAEREQLTPDLPAAWVKAGFDAAGERAWRTCGLGPDDAELALYLGEKGIWPEDLRLMLRGREAGKRLRDREESRHVLANEILEVRARGSVGRRELPSTAVVKRRKTS